jgi:hypothetical protein
MYLTALKTAIILCRGQPRFSPRRKAHHALNLEGQRVTPASGNMLRGARLDLLDSLKIRFVSVMNEPSSARGKSWEFQWQVANHRYAQKCRCKPPIPGAPTWCLSYDVCLNHGEKIVLPLKSVLLIPELREAGYVAGLVENFEQLLQSLIIKPLLAAFSQCQQQQARILASENPQDDGLDAEASMWSTIPDDYPASLPEKPGKKAPSPGQ